MFNSQSFPVVLIAMCSGLKVESKDGRKVGDQTKNSLLTF